jgi:hypothetical protein
LKTAFAQRRAGRRGASLVEVVVLIGAVTVIISLCGVFLHLLLRVDRAGRSAQGEASAVARLARQFRQDVRAANSGRVAVAKEGESGGTLELTLGDGVSISYANGDGRVLRTESAGGTARRREGYEFRGFGPAAFAAEGGTARLSLDRLADPRAGGAARPGYRLEARVGKDLELARRGGDAK